MIKVIQKFFVGTLRKQLIVAGFLIFCTFIVVMEVSAVRLQSELLHQKLIARSQNYGRLISRTSLEPVLTGDLITLAEAMDAVKGLPEILYAAVIDPQGKVLGHTDQRYVEKYLIDKDHQQCLDEARQSLQPVILSDSMLEVETVVPQVEGGRVIGFVRIGLNGQATMDLVRQFALKMITLGIVLLVLGVLVAFMIGQKIIGCLPALTSAVFRFKVGDDIPPLPVSREDEVGALARQIKQFMVELNAKDKEIRDHQQGLELKVKERTAALEAQSAELKRINKFFIDRENRMAELKEEVRHIKQQLQQERSGSHRGEELQ